MCTVTFLPISKKEFILTSNRDESKQRKTLPPKKYIENGVEMIFPKDEVAGGTWIGLSEKKRLVCVLNGAFIKHKRKVFYKMSRGLLAKQLLATKNTTAFISKLDLEGIEPFTMVLVDWQKELKLYEFIWDEKQKHFNTLPLQPKIWSSSTLYSQKIKLLREKWFANWLVTQKKFTSKEIIAFHHSKEGTEEDSIFMKREKVETVSITCVKKEKQQLVITYKDILKKEVFTTSCKY